MLSAHKLRRGSYWINNYNNGWKVLDLFNRCDPCESLTRVARVAFKFIKIKIGFVIKLKMAKSFLGRFLSVFRWNWNGLFRFINMREWVDGWT